MLLGCIASRVFCFGLLLFVLPLGGFALWRNDLTLVLVSCCVSVILWLVVLIVWGLFDFRLCVCVCTLFYMVVMF